MAHSAVARGTVSRQAKVRIPVQIEPLEEGGDLAICDRIQGCHAEGETISEALENIEDVARILLELQVEENLICDEIFEQVEPGVVIEARLIED